MPRVPRKCADRVIGVKFPIEIDERIQRVEQVLHERSMGLPVPTTFVMCEIATRGLDVYERELGITKSPKAKREV